MQALQPIVGFFNTIITVLRPTVFVVAVTTAAAAAASWAVRTRRIGPFTAFARLTRRTIDPMFLPAERRVVRYGGLPAQAPWWTLAAVVVASLIVLSLLQFINEQLMMLAASSLSGSRTIAMLVMNWVFMLLKLALLARVISSWVGGSPYSPWWKWSYRSTDWLLVPLRRVLPTFGALDLSPVVAYFSLSLLQSLIGGAM